MAQAASYPALVPSFTMAGFTCSVFTPNTCPKLGRHPVSHRLSHDSLRNPPQALEAAPEDAERHATYLAALNRHRKPAEVLRVADAHRPASNPAVVVEV